MEPTATQLPTWHVTTRTGANTWTEVPDIEAADPHAAGRKAISLLRRNGYATVTVCRVV